MVKKAVTDVMPKGSKPSDVTKFGRNKEAVKKANDKYLMNLEMISFRVKKGDKDRIKEHALSMNESLNQFLIRAVENQISEDIEKK